MSHGLDKSPPIPKMSNRCYWCGNGLDRLRNVYKGKDSERHYCSSDHLQKGETRHLTRAEQALRRGFDVVT